MAKAIKRKASKRRVAKCVGNEVGIACSREARTELPKSKDYKCAQCKKIDKRAGLQVRLEHSLLLQDIMKLCERAGTLQTFTTISDLDFWYELAKANRKIDSKLDRSHLIAANDADWVGLTNRYNMVLADSALNKRLRMDRVFGCAIEGIHYIDRDKLERKWIVTGLINKQEFIEKLSSYFGQKEFTNWVADKQFRTWAELEEKEEVEAIKFSTRSRLSFAIEQLTQFGCWLGGEALIEFGIAWTGFYLGFVHQHGKDPETDKDEELTKVAKLIEEALLRGQDSLLRKATEIMKEQASYTVKL